MSEEGQVLAGRYRLQRLIGSGSMGVVWQAVDERLHRTVALKQLQLPPGQAPKRAADARERAMREGRIAARLHHPNAIAVHDVVEDNGQPLLVMEYLPARSLTDVLAEHGPMSPRQAAGIGAQAASALAAAHEAGIVHRDIKPGNLLLGDDGTVKITDFGISRAVGDITVTQSGLLAGTPAYLAPEVARGQEPPLASDVFSLGATLYEAVEGTPPFGHSDNSIALLHEVAAGRFPSPRHAGPLTVLLARMMRTEATERPAMNQVADALRSVAAGLPAPELPETDTTGEVTHPVGRVEAPAARSTRTASPSPGSGSSGTRVGLPPPRRRMPGRRTLYTAAGVLAVMLVSFLIATQLGAGGGQGTALPPPPRRVAPQELERVVSDYYALLPEHTENAWTRLSPSQQAQDRARYDSFWSAVSGLVVTVPPRVVAANTVSVSIELTMSDSTKVREVHHFGMVVRETTPLIDSDTILETERIPAPVVVAPPRSKPDEQFEEGERGEDRKGENRKGRDN